MENLARGAVRLQENRLAMAQIALRGNEKRGTTIRDSRGRAESHSALAWESSTVQSFAVRGFARPFPATL